MALGQWALPLAAMVGTQVTLNSYKSGGQCDFLGQPLGQKPRSMDIVSTLWPQAGGFTHLPQKRGGQQILDKDTKALPSCGVRCIQHKLGDACGPVQRMLRATSEKDSGNLSFRSVLAPFSS